MLLRHSFHYLLARGIPALFGFAAIVVYSRLLSPEEYGLYILVTAGVGLANVVVFQWLKLSLLRFLPAHEKQPRDFLATILATFLALLVLTAVIGLPVLALWPNLDFRLGVLAILLLWAHGWLDLILEIFRSRLQPTKYGLFASLKSSLAIVIGTGLVLGGFGAGGPLLGLLAGMALAGLLGFRQHFSGVRPRLGRHLPKLLAYGWPLTATFALGYFVSYSDRFFLAGLINTGTAGQYAVAYDLAHQSMSLMLAIVNLAAFPLAIKSLENEGVEAATAQLQHNGTVVLTVALPAACGLFFLAPNISEVMLGIEYRATATLILPLVAIASLLLGLKAYFFDLAFHLGGWTLGQTWGLLAAAGLNLGLNLILIPRYGVAGAAWATIFAYTLALALSILLGRKAFRITMATNQVLRILAASLAMIAVLWPLKELTGPLALAAQVTLGAGTYMVAILAMNLDGIRDVVRNHLRNRRKRHPETNC